MIPAEAIAHEDGSWSLPVSRRALPKRDAKLMQLAAREQAAISLAYAKADAIVPIKQLKTKLGATTFRLYVALLQVRNQECLTHPSTPGLAKQIQSSERQVEKSLARLRQFKLVEDYGFMYQQVPCRCPKSIGYHEHKIYVRKVYGFLKKTADLMDTSAMVPHKTASLIRDAAGQGGKRKGAGRPAGVKDSAPRSTIKGGVKESKGGAYKYQEITSYEVLSELQRRAPFHGAHESTSQEGLERESKGAPDFPVRGVPSLQHEEEVAALVQTSEVSMPSTLQPKPQAVAACSDPDETAPQAAHSSPQPASAADPAVQVEVDGQKVDLLDALRGSGAREITFGGGGSSRPRQRYTSEDLRASTELLNQIPQCLMPPPPNLREGQTEERQLTILDAAFRAAHARVLGKEYFQRKAKARTAKDQQVMREAIAALQAEKINPLMWARFSLHCWQRAGKTNTPSIKWLWSPQRIHEHAGWCHESTDSCQGRTQVRLPSITALINLWAQVRDSLGYGEPTAKVVERILPATKKRVLLAKAAAEIEKTQTDLERRIGAGEWVWA